LSYDTQENHHEQKDDEEEANPADEPDTPIIFAI
jgi:hypothetical protein